LQLTEIGDILTRGVILKCQQKLKENPIVYANSVILRITGMRLTKKDVKNTPPGKKRADVPAAAKNYGRRK
jgi:chorismate-pyruvate lyase